VSKPNLAALVGCALTVFSAGAASSVSEPRLNPIAESIQKLRDASVIAEYPTYSLIRGQDGRVQRRSAAGVEAIPQDNMLHLNRAPFDTQVGEPNVPTVLRAKRDGEGSSLHLVQFAGPIQQAWLDQLKADGVTPVHYLPTNGYLVWTDAAGRAKLDSQAKAKGALQYAGDYHPFYKLNDDLAAPYGKSGKGPGSGQVEITVQVYSHPGINSTQNSIAALSSQQTQNWYDILNYRNARFVVNEADIAAIAALPDVVWVGRYVQREMNDEVQNQILAGQLTGDGSAPTGIGYLPWLIARGFSTNPAAYPIVDITDDGVDDMDTTPQDPTLWPNGVISGTSRLGANDACTANGTAAVQGHGHINTNIIGGYDVRANTVVTGARFPITDVANGLGYQRGLGVNPHSRLAATRIFNGSGSYDVSLCGGNDLGVMKRNQDHGAAISSNSWGAAVGGAYDDSSQAYDAGTRDSDTTEAGNQQLFYVFSAGNSGSGSNTIGTPGTGKNVLTVGASENWRPTDENGNWTDGCNIGPTGADNAMDTISFSSRGPTDDTRTKPEITAPGTHITGTQAPTGVGGSTCDDERPVGNATYAASSGTSHSAPAVSGVASLTYWWLRNNPQSNLLFDGGGTTLTAPSPAGLKAYLLAHPTPLNGVSNSGNLPTQTQGYGMPNMDLLFDSTPKFMVDQTVTFDNSGGANYQWIGAIADEAKPVRVVLTWTDAPGPLSGNAYINNLNLEVEVNGTTYKGNVFNGHTSTTGGTADAVNNYEAVFLPAGTSGAITVRVIPANIAGDGVPGSGDATDQDFALVISNGLEEPTFTVNAEPESQQICTQDSSAASYSVAVGSILGFSTPVNLSFTGTPAGASGSLASSTVAPGSATTLNFSNLNAATAGTYTINVSGTDGADVRDDAVSLKLTTADAGAPGLTTPANGVIGFGIGDSFTWSAGAQADEYLLEVATDAGFNNVIRSTLVTATTANFAGNELPSNSVLYWRVTAANICGSTTSSVRSFTTEALPGDCPLGTDPVEIATDNLESGAVGWTHSGTGDTWALSTTRNHSPANSFKGTDSAAVSDQRLVTPSYTLPTGDSGYTLTYWSFHAFEGGATSCYDAGLLEVSTDGGTVWTQVPGASLLTDPYDGTVSTGFSNPLAGLSAWCRSQDWTRSVVDLDAYAGQNVQFRFRLGSDSSVGAEGWYVDDLRIQSCRVASTNLIFRDGFE